ncbi:MAG: hypothetical protein IKR92_01735 [Alphaproteobacteria bacterium]|nr:hypothetical protein [Alphaproteobacteria bacterium]
MNEVWKRMLLQSKSRIEEKKRRRQKIIGFVTKTALALLCLYWLFPQYIRRVIYAPFFGTPTTQPLQISATDSFEDVTAPSFRFTRGKYTYTLVPRTKYAVTGRVGIVDDYDTLFNRFYRGQFQGDYINLVPRDIMLLIGQMAEPSVFAKFDFVHEERMGGVRCKGVKYKNSFMPSFMSAEKAEKNWDKYNECNQFIKNEELNNYHPIPANERINKALSMLVRGDVVYLEGVLVDVPEMRLNTGTRKEQTHSNMMVAGQAPGMCFILYTTKVILHNRVYE